MLKKLTVDDIDQVAKIHREELSGFLPELGKEFLEKFYKVSLDIPEMFTLVERRNGQVLGFVTGVASAKGLYKKIFFRDVLSFTILLLRYFITHSKEVVKIGKIITYPGFSDDSPELLTIAVERKHQRRGIGRKLFFKVVEEFGKRDRPCKIKNLQGKGDKGDGGNKGKKVKNRGKFFVSVYDRLPANAFYKKIGCAFYCSFDFLGEKMNYYSCEIK